MRQQHHKHLLLHLVDAWNRNPLVLHTRFSGQQVTDGLHEKLEKETLRQQLKRELASVKAILSQHHGNPRAGELFARASEIEERLKE